MLERLGMEDSIIIQKLGNDSIPIYTEFAGFDFYTEEYNGQEEEFIRMFFFSVDMYRLTIVMSKQDDLIYGIQN